MPNQFAIVSAWAGFVVVLVYANLFEYAFHRWLMHRLHRYVSQPYETHVRLHHRIFGGDRRYHVLRAEHRSFILFEWWGAPVIVGLHAPVLWGVQAASGWPLFWLGLAALTLYYGLYEYLHWCMHNPVGRRIERTRIFRYLDANHRLHHACWRLNFNVVCPFADIVFGTYRARSAPGSPRLFDNPHLPSLPRVKADIYGMFGSARADVTKTRSLKFFHTQRAHPRFGKLNRMIRQKIRILVEGIRAKISVGRKSAAAAPPDVKRPGPRLDPGRKERSQRRVSRRVGEIAVLSNTCHRAAPAARPFSPPAGR